MATHDVSKDRLLTATEAAGIIERSESRIRQLISSGQIAVERFGREVRIRESEAKRYKATLTVPDSLPMEREAAPV